MEEKDLYAVLGVARGASADDIRTAYRKLARKHHPDVNPNDAKAADRFKEISFANEVLSDTKKRALYDEFGVRGLESGFDPEQARAYQRWSQGARRSPGYGEFTSEIDLDDLLSGLYGGGEGMGFGTRAGAGFGRRQAGPRQGADAEGSVAVDFLDAVRGGKVTLQMEGRGALQVTIPPGADDGTRIRLAGQGEPGARGGPAGDLYLVLRVRPHAFFRRDGADVLLELPVTVPELILGAAVEVPTPDGRATVKIPPGSQNGRKLRLRGKGATRRKAPGVSSTDPRGDLLITLRVTLPENLASPEAAADLERIARDLAPLYDGVDVRAGLGRA